MACDAQGFARPRRDRRWSTAAPGCHRRRLAFTLIELVTVITIVALIGVSVGGPTLTYLSAVRTRGAAARIAADLRYAQRWAMSTRNRTWIAFNTGANTYTLYVENPAAPGKPGRLLLARALDGVTAATNVGESPFTGARLTSVNLGGGAEVEFDSLGRPFNAGSVALSSPGQIQLAGGVTVSVTPVTGLAEVAG